MGMNHKIHIGFCFHVNFHHADLGDTNDERGFGQDLSSVRHILEILSKVNNEGQPVMASWDVENEYTLGRMLPSLGPDVIDQVKGRIRERGDELLFSGKSGELFAGMTGKEMRGAIRKALTGSASVVTEEGENKVCGTKVMNALGETSGVLCTELSLFSPAMISNLKKSGINAVLIGNSAVGPDAASTVLGELKKNPYFAYNPITYRHNNDAITMIPVYSPADLIDAGSMTRFVSDLHEKQMSGEIGGDILVMIGADVRSFWWDSLEIKTLFGSVPGTEGLEGFLKDIRKFDYIAYNTPTGYMRDHAEVSEISFAGDLAAGFDSGLSELGELPYDRLIWTRLERARIGSKSYKADRMSDSLEKRTELISAPLFGTGIPAPVKDSFDKAEKLSLEIQGLERKAIVSKEMSMRTSGRQRLNNSAIGKHLYSRRKDDEERNTFIIMNTSGQKAVTFQLAIDKGQCPKISALVLECDECKIEAFTAVEMKSEDGFVTSVFVVMRFAEAQSTYKIYYHFDRKDLPKEEHKPLIDVKPEDIPVFHAEGAMKRLLEAQGKLPKPVEKEPEDMTSPAVSERIAAMNKAAATDKPGAIPSNNEKDTYIIQGYGKQLKIIINGTGAGKGKVREVFLGDERIGDDQFLASFIKCGGVTTAFECEKVEDAEFVGMGTGVKISGAIHAKGEIKPGAYAMSIIQTPALRTSEGVLVLVDVKYPEFSSSESTRPEEIVPFQISPLYRAGVSVIRKNFMGDISDFPVSCFGKTVKENSSISSFNNQVTGGIVGIKGALSGIVISHARCVLGSMAMCPGRLITDGEGQHLSINPFGTYGRSGRKYPTLSEGLIQRFNDDIMAPEPGNIAAAYSGVQEKYCMCLSAFSGAGMSEGQLSELNAFSDGAIVCGDDAGVIHPFEGDNITLPESQRQIQPGVYKKRSVIDIKNRKSEIGKYINHLRKEK